MLKNLGYVVLGLSVGFSAAKFDFKPIAKSIQKQFTTPSIVGKLLKKEPAGRYDEWYFVIKINDGKSIVRVEHMTALLYEIGDEVNLKYNWNNRIYY